MGLFVKNKKNEFEEGHNNNLFSDDDDYITPLQHRIITGESRVTAPHAITAEELMGHTENIPMRPNTVRTSNSVYESMKEHNKKDSESSIDDDYVPSWADSSPESSLAAFSNRTKVEMSAEETADAARRAEAILKTTNVRTESANAHREMKPLFVNSEEVVASATAQKAETAKNEPEVSSSFLQRCKMVVMGNSVDTSTESTEVIPMMSADKTKAKEVSIEKEEEDFETIINRLQNERRSEERSEENAADTSTKLKEIKVDVEIIPDDVPSEVMHTESDSVADTQQIPMEPVVDEVAEEIVNDVKVYGKTINDIDVGQTAESDGAVADVFATQSEAEQTRVIGELESTRMFDGVDNVISQKADDSFNISREFYEDDVEVETKEEVNVPYYETEDLEIADIEDYKNLNDAAKLRTEYESKKSSGKLKTAISFAIFAVALLLSLPIMDLVSVVANGIVSMILLVSSLVVNVDIFKDFKNIFKSPKFDSCVAITAIFAFVQTAVSAFAYEGAYAFLAAYATLLLAVNRYTKFSKTNRIATGLEKIANSEQKTAVCITDDTASKVIASGAVEGDVLGVVTKKAVNVQGFIKSSNYKSPFDLKVKTLLLVGVIVSVVAGIMASVFASFGAGITVCTAMLICAFPICAGVSAEMPMNRIAKRLADKDAVLAGFKGAYDINQTNTVAVKTSDLFLEGTVKLYNMKTLSENEIGQTLTAAAAVAYAAESPLASVFRDMVGVSSEKDLPKVNGVQYEDKMGISGWIGDNTVLIGNRNLMQGHSVAVPPATVDQKILKAGYFPVYIACKGVPCLLFVVKYEVDPEVRRELVKVCNTGMTILVNPQDPNASEAMICDYFGIPDNALRVMNHNGRVMYERRTKPEETVTAPAVAGKDVKGLFATVTASINISLTIALLTAIFIVAAALGGVLLLYLGVLGKLAMITSFALTVYQTVFLIISVIAMKVKDR